MIKWLNKDSRLFLERGYLKAEVSAEQRMREIAEAAEKILGIAGFADRFELYLHKGWYSLSSPVWSNFGAGRGLSISCNGSYIADKVDAILGKAAEIGMMSKHGAGTSGYFGDIRAQGATISTGGKADGPVRFMQLYEKTTDIISQSNVRRGSFAAYLPVEHPDILEFLKIRGEGNPIQHMSLGVCISDQWMKEMTEGDKVKRKVWGEILKKRFESGYPYIFFSDTVNNAAPQVYKDKGLRIHASNLCVTGDTLIEVVARGQESIMIRIQDLGFYMKRHEDVRVKSYDVENQRVVYSDAVAFAQTGESTDLMEIEDEKGNVLRCTPEHKIFTRNRGYVEAQYLREDDILHNMS